MARICTVLVSFPPPLSLTVSFILVGRFLRFELLTNHLKVPSTSAATQITRCLPPMSFHTSEDDVNFELLELRYLA